MSPTHSRLGLPHLGHGVGLRNQHLRHILEHGPGVDWFEIISENFIGNHGFARYALDQIRERTPIVMHGVSLSIGSTDPLDFDYLKDLKRLADELRPAWISDHLCWTGVFGLNSHELLPLPLNDESFRHVAQRLRIVQDYLERPLVLENPSSYIQFRSSTMTEWDFLAALTGETGCGLLLDLNNVHVSGLNHAFDPEHYVRSIPLDRVVQIHLAGPTDHGGYLIDTHSKPVPSAVWELFDLVRDLGLEASVLLEWDADIPPYPDLLRELAKARNAAARAADGASGAAASPARTIPISTPVDFQLGECHEQI